jgi:predicted enzyme related to lactoylglutathione lyase
MSQHQNFSMDYVEFPATDIEATKRFYNQVFGWDFKDWGPDYTSFHDGRTGGGFTTESHVASGAGVLVVLYAANLQETYQKVKATGGRIVREIFEFPGGRRFHFADPNGNELAVWSE